jgi:hypothetical protein
MPDDALERVLRLVAEGRLTADEAGPDPGCPRGARWLEWWCSGDPGTERGRQARPDHEPRSREDPPCRGHRWRPCRRQPAHPAVAGSRALSQVPGISDATTDRIREAITAGIKGPDRRRRRRRRRGSGSPGMTALDVVARPIAAQRGCPSWRRSWPATSAWLGRRERLPPRRRVPDRGRLVASSWN